MQPINTNNNGLLSIQTSRLHETLFEKEDSTPHMYHTSDRRRTIARMLTALPDMDTEMRQLANSTIAKLEQMTDADFDGQRFNFAGE